MASEDPRTSGAAEHASNYAEQSESWMFVEDAGAAEHIGDNLSVVATAGDDGPWNMQDGAAEHITEHASRPSEEIVHSFVYCAAGRLDDDSVRTQTIRLVEHPMWPVNTGNAKKEVVFMSFGYSTPCHGSWRLMTPYKLHIWFNS